MELVLKSTVLLEITKEIQKHESLQNLRPKLVPTSKNVSFMATITSIKSCVLDMENNLKENESETLRQNVSNISQKTET